MLLGAVKEPYESGVLEPTDLDSFLEAIKQRFKQSAAKYVAVPSAILG